MTMQCSLDTFPAATPAAPVREAPARNAMGDFLFAIGPDAAQLRTPAGYAARADGTAHVALRGAVQHGVSFGGTRWLGVADLVEGRLAEGSAALCDGDVPQRRWRGRFVQVAWHAESGRVVALTDHFSTLPLYALERGGNLLLATDFRLLAASTLCSRDIDPVAIYHYLNFACIPAPRTMCADIAKLAPGTCLRWQAGRSTQARYFLPSYPQDLDGSDATLATGLRERIVASVHDYRPAPSRAWGCFLSGGTDSSSIVSILSTQKPDERVRSFSIGFAEQGYDELDYAQLVAQACSTQAYSARVDRGEALELLDRVVACYDQPFGNASAVPSLACAGLAREHGIDTLLAGDGGDEIFGGNQRYAKDHVMSMFYGLPLPLKRAAGALGRLAGKSSRHFLQRVQNFTERASLPNPDRFYTDDSFGSDYHDALLQPDFRTHVRRDASLQYMREVYAEGGEASPLHRIMRLDLAMAIAQNDLVKVHGACRAHGISARFPYLDPDLVTWTGRLPERYKVRGTAKRYLFKQAMAGILPDAVLRKKKQGFGLPIAVWLRNDPLFQSRVRDVLSDPRTRSRGWFHPAFVETLLAEHVQGSWDHSHGIWQLLVLELWSRKYLDAT